MVEKEESNDSITQFVPQKDEYGNIIYEQYPDSVFGNGKFRSSDLRNYRDGDAMSSFKSENWKKELSPDEATASLYAPDGDSADGILSPRLTNTVRVYKGGGWRDRLYYLNPALRRYLEEAKSKNDLGFRCAMG